MPDANVNNIPVLTIEDEFVFFTPPAEFTDGSGRKLPVSEAFGQENGYIFLEPQAFEDYAGKGGTLPVLDTDTTEFLPPSFDLLLEG